jgi:hypothetical protein
MLRRIWFPFFAVAWIGLAVWFWWNLIADAPTSTFFPDSKFQMLAFSDAGELITCQRGSPSRGPWALCGPIDYWNLTSGRKTSWLDEQDGLDSNYLSDTGDAIMRRGESLLLVDLNHRKEVCDLPATDRVFALGRVLDGRCLIYNCGNTIRLHDLAENRERWSAVGYRFYWGANLDFAVVGLAGTNANSSTGYDVLNLKTGSHDPRFDLPEKTFEIRAWKDWPYTLTRHSTTWAVHDNRTGKVIWSLPDQRFVNFRFENNNSELVTDVLDANARLVSVRWKADDGTVLTPAPEKISGFALRQKTPDGRYALDLEMSDPNTVSQWLRRLERYLKLKKPLSLGESVVRVVDLADGRTVGRIDSGKSRYVVPDNSGFVVVSDDRLDFYTFPPRRNWRWLAIWGFAPVAAAWIIRFAIRRRQRRLTDPIGSPNEQPRPATET